MLDPAPAHATREFAQLVNDLVLRTFKVCDEALQQAGVIARDLDGVILVGGPTRLPLIREAVRQYFQQEPKTDVDPDQVVAMGAAIHAASLISSDQEAFLLDVTPLSLRIGVAGDMAESVIERNTPVPIEQTRTFTTFQDDQASVQIRVYQGESRVASENELLGQFEFTGFRKARRGEVAIDVTFEINADGIVNVTARDQETGNQSSTRITLSSGLSENELKSIIEEARTDRVQTAMPSAAVPALPPAPQPVAARAPQPAAAACAAARRSAQAPQPAAAARAAAGRAAQADTESGRGARAERRSEPDARRRGARGHAARARDRRAAGRHRRWRRRVRPPTASRPTISRPRPTRRPPTSTACSSRRAQATSDLAAEPVDDALELLDDDDLAALAPEIDLEGGDPTPSEDDASAAGLFDAPGTDLSTLPDLDTRKKS